MRRTALFFVAAGFGLLLCGLVLVAAPAHPPVIFGFTSQSSAMERAVERRFLAMPSADRARDAHAFLTAEPHVAGSTRDRVLAEWVRDRWREYGLEQVEIVEHDVFLPYATDVAVEIVSPTPWRASLKEDPIAGDPATAVDLPPPYHAYSASGDLTAPVVYAGSGNPADYDALDAHGVDIKGKIALVRYSVPYSYRGFKALTAQRRGAAGVLIYSDPEDDGVKKGKTYPDGPWGPESHIQRGGVVYDFLVPGDPLTPGWPSVRGAKRIAAADAVSLPKITTAPLSWKDAKVIRQALDRGPVTIHLRVKMDDAVRPIWTVIGRLAGAAHPEDLVVVGNHRDAWVYGGVDPSSGTATMMELARSLGALAKQGTRPKRTIVFASWDAEEFTLTSSTEWGEEHERELSAHAVAYLNVDSAASGKSFSAAAVPALNRAITEAAESVIDPETGRTIADAARTGAPREGGALPTATGPDLVSNRLGSGSDYTVFLNFLGVPVADLSFTGPYGVYHSIYDDHLWVQKFGDPGFRYHAAMVRLWGVLALRIANADVVPLDYRPYAARIREFVDEVAKQGSAADRAAFAPLQNAIDRFTKVTASFGGRADVLLSARSVTNAQTAPLNAALMQAERALLSPAGIPGRPWYRHLIYAPKPTYAPEVLPGIAEAGEAGDRKRLTEQIAALAAALEKASMVFTRAGDARRAGQAGR
jgi:N-acetylated-alpha-linked acidic dipeptidase